MINSIEQYIFNFLLSYSSQPFTVYILIAVLMTAGSFGLPISEEIIIIAAGLIAFIGSNPELYPPPENIEHTVTISSIAIVCFLSVFLSDTLVYLLGRILSHSLEDQKYFHRFISKKKMKKISKLIAKYGYFYPAIFRFTPGLRFPGHFSCGLFRIPLSQFIIVDGFTALLTVPTQIILIGIFGYSIIKYLKEFIFFIAIISFLFILFVIINKLKEIKNIIQKKDIDSQNDE